MRRPRAGLRSRLRFGAVALFAVVAVATANVAAADTTSDGYSAYIVNGTSTTIAKWPFLVELLHHGTANTYDAQFCDGSLVAPTIVLTAAHCTYSDALGQHPIDKTEVDVLVGADHLGTNQGHRITVSAITRDAYVPSSMLHDDALLTLSSPAPVTPVQVVPSSSDYRWAAGRPAKVAGFGCTKFDLVSGSCEKYPTDLHETPLPIISSGACESSGLVYAHFYNPQTMVCAGATGGTATSGDFVFGTSKGTCYGDSGGPLVVNGPNGPLQIGVVSWGPGACGTGPSVFTRLGRDATRDWLRNHGVPVAHAPFIGGAAVNIDGSYRTASGDFNNDGKDDLLLYGPGSTPDQLLLWSANGFVASGWNVTMAGNDTPLVGDFDGDGYRDDVYWYARGAGTDVLWLGGGTGFTAGWAVSQPVAAMPIVGNFDGDAGGKDDIFWYRPGSASESLWLSTGLSFPDSGWSVNVGGTYKPVAGDFNGDGNTDIFWYGSGSASDFLWRGGATGFTSQSFTVNGVFRPFTGDFDGDGKADIFWYGPGSAIDRLWRGSATNFSNGPEVVVNGSYLPVAGAFNGDVRSDVVWYAPGTTPDWEWYGNIR